MHEIGFTEGFHLARAAGLDIIGSMFVAFVWCLRGDKVSDD
jgi:hypothetical protein